MCLSPQVLEKLAQEQVTLNARSSSAEEAFKAAHTEHDKLIISSKEAQHAKEQAKQVSCSTARTLLFVDGG